MQQQQMQAPGPKPPQAPQQAAAAGEPEVIRNLMVNYIPTTIDEVQLRQLFEMYGPVESVKIVVDRETRTSKGYGFVKFRFAFSAVHAIQYLNGYPLMNKRLKVAYSNQAEAQKTLLSQSQAGPESHYMPYPHAPAPGQPDESQAAWAQQMSYMQQLAAIQMMQQYQQTALPQHHHHHHHHHAHSAQQPARAPHQHHQHHAHHQHHQIHQHHHHAPQQPQQPQQTDSK